MAQLSIPINQLDIVTVYDPARSRESEYGRLARHAILTAGMDSEYNIFVLDAWALRTSLDNVLIELERQCDVWSPRIVGVESTAAQAAIADICYTWISMHHNIAPVYTDLLPDTRINKRWRIRMEIQRVAPYGKLYLQQHMYDLRTELFGMPNGRTIDLCDVLAYAIQLLNPPVASIERSIDEFARKMRRQRGDHTIEYEDHPYLHVPKVRKPPSDNSVVWSRAS